MYLFIFLVNETELCEMAFYCTYHILLNTQHDITQKATKKKPLKATNPSHPTPTTAKTFIASAMASWEHMKLQQERKAAIEIPTFVIVVFWKHKQAERKRGRRSLSGMQTDTGHCML